MEDCCAIPSILPADALEACDNGILFFIVNILCQQQTFLNTILYKLLKIITILPILNSSELQIQQEAKAEETAKQAIRRT